MHLFWAQCKRDDLSPFFVTGLQFTHAYGNFFAFHTFVVLKPSRANTDVCTFAHTCTHQSSVKQCCKPKSHSLSTLTYVRNLIWTTMHVRFPVVLSFGLVCASWPESHFYVQQFCNKDIWPLGKHENLVHVALVTKQTDKRHQKADEISILLRFLSTDHGRVTKTSRSIVTDLSKWTAALRFVYDCLCKGYNRLAIGRGDAS